MPTFPCQLQSTKWLLSHNCNACGAACLSMCTFLNNCMVTSWSYGNMIGCFSLYDRLALLSLISESVPYVTYNSSICISCFTLFANVVIITARHNSNLGSVCCVVGATRDLEQSKWQLIATDLKYATVPYAASDASEKMCNSTCSGFFVITCLGMTISLSSCSSCLKLVQPICCFSDSSWSQSSFSCHSSCRNIFAFTSTGFTSPSGSINCAVFADFQKFCFYDSVDKSQFHILCADSEKSRQIRLWAIIAFHGPSLIAWLDSTKCLTCLFHNI